MYNRLYAVPDCFCEAVAYRKLLFLTLSSSASPNPDVHPDWKQMKLTLPPANKRMEEIDGEKYGE